MAIKSGVARTSVQWTQHFHMYKIHLFQELNKNDFDRRLHFCEHMSNWIIEGEHFLFIVYFCDKLSLSFNGTVNWRNYRFCWMQILTFLRDTHSTTWKTKCLGWHFWWPLGKSMYFTLQFKLRGLFTNISRERWSNINWNYWKRWSTFWKYFNILTWWCFTTLCPICLAAFGCYISLDFYLWGYLKSKIYST